MICKTNEAYKSFTVDGLRIKRPMDSRWYDPERDGDYERLSNEPSKKSELWVVETKRVFVVDSSAIPIGEEHSYRCSCEIIARNKGEAIKESIRRPEMKNWVKYSREINRPPFAGLVAREKKPIQKSGLLNSIKELWKRLMRIF